MSFDLLISLIISPFFLDILFETKMFIMMIDIPTKVVHPILVARMMLNPTRSRGNTMHEARSTSLISMIARSFASKLVMVPS